MRFLALAPLIALTACGGGGEQMPMTLDTNITVAGHFGEDGDTSYDVSGLACDWQAGGEAVRCLILEDEGQEAQWASFDGNVLSAGQRFGVIAATAPLGTSPRNICSDADLENPEFDGEAAALSDGVYYVTGSHGCSRDSNEFRPAGFIVARVTPDDPGIEVQPGAVSVETSHRLSGMFQRDPRLARYFGTSLRHDNGLNIEGLAVAGNRMIFGLRGPVINGEAFLFETTATALFSREIVGPGRSIAVPLGINTGIRDLAFLPDGRLLILSGPAQEQNVPYRLHLRDDDGTVTTLQTTSAPYGGKAEVIAIVGTEADSVTLLVLFDGVADGAPRLIEVDIAP